MIGRAERFSPNSAENDKAILEAVAGQLLQRGFDVGMVSEDDPDCKDLIPQAEVVFSMGRRPETLAVMKSLDGQRQINSPQGVENCCRRNLQRIMQRIGIPVPPDRGNDGYWLKRGDSSAQSKDDVVYAANEDELAEKISGFEARGIVDYLVSAHIVGDLMKFYGVRDTGFFRYYYPTDDGQTKFDNELHNGEARHYPFDIRTLQQEAELLAEAVGIEVYGGDCIVRADGSYCFIDFNDWPSFSRCREDAAVAIAELGKVKRKKGK